MHRLKSLVLVFAAVTMMACAPMLSALATGSTHPPTLPANVNTMSRGAIDFAANSFDAALYGLDFAMDAHKLIPGSPKAKSLAALGRKVQGFINGAEAARLTGNSASYEEAFRHANEALTQFRALLGSTAVGMAGPPMKPADRIAILDRLTA